MNYSKWQIESYREYKCYAGWFLAANLQPNHPLEDYLLTMADYQKRYPEQSFRLRHCVTEEIILSDILQ